MDFDLGGGLAACAGPAADVDRATKRWNAV